MGAGVGASLATSPRRTGWMFPTRASPRLRTEPWWSSGNWNSRRASERKFTGREYHVAGFWGRNNSYLDGGGRGIRTPEPLSGLTVFKTAGFNRSPIPPALTFQQFTSTDDFLSPPTATLAATFAGCF